MFHQDSLDIFEQDIVIESIKRSEENIIDDTENHEQDKTRTDHVLELGLITCHGIPCDGACHSRGIRRQGRVE